MIEKLLLKLRARDVVSEQEEAALRGLVSEVRDHSARELVIRKNRHLNESLLLLEGMMCRYKDLRNGRRQISALHVPGDFLDLHSFTLEHLDHDVSSITASKVAVVPHKRLTEVTRDLPHLTRVLWFSTNLDAAMHREWEVSLGQRTAIERAAHLICELQIRLGVVGLARANGYKLQMNQTELAECLGITSIHMNRVIRELRERNLAIVRNKAVTICDFERLERTADFDASYLYLDRQAR